MSINIEQTGSRLISSSKVEPQSLTEDQTRVRDRILATLTAERPSWRDEEWRFNLLAQEVHHLSDLQVWTVQLPGVTSTTGLRQPGKSNPIHHDGTLYASICTPGQIVAYDPQSGRQLWCTPLDSFGSASLLYSEGRIYASSYGSLYALDSRDGSIIWNIPDSGGVFAPVLVNGRLIWGDGYGEVFCVDGRTGDLIGQHSAIWARKKNGLTTAVVCGELVIIPVSRTLIVALEILTGKEVWRTRVAQYISHTCSIDSEHVAIGSTSSVYILNTRDGSVISRNTWNRDEVRSLAVTPYGMLVALDNQYGMRNPPPGRSQPIPNARLAGVGPNRKYHLKYPTWSGVALKWCETTNLLYEATRYGLGIVHSVKGVRLASIIDIEPYDTGMDFNDFTTIPVAVDDKLYFLSETNRLIAVRNPALM